MPVVKAEDTSPPPGDCRDSPPAAASADALGHASVPAPVTNRDSLVDTDQMDVDLDAGDASGGNRDAELAPATPSEIQPQPDSDAYGNEVKPESDDEHQLDDDDGDNNPFEAAKDPLHNYKSPDPDCTAANALPFPTLVKRFETIWQQKKKVANKQSKDELLNYLLPRKMLDEHLAGFSLFPLFRLIMPDIDTMRPNMGMKEKKIASTWSAAMGLSKESAAYRKLHRFMDPAYAGHTGTGDLSICVKEVVEERFPSTGSKLTVGDVNKLLDELKDITNSASNRAGSGGRSAAHGWRQAGVDGNAEGATAPTLGGKENKTKKKKSVSQRQIKWVEKLIRLNMSPLEHKWIVRLLLCKMELGFSYKVILNHYHPGAKELLASNNNLQTLCTNLSDPEYLRRRDLRNRRNLNEARAGMDAAHFPIASEPAELGHTIQPMLSNRTNFEAALSDIHTRHQQYMEALPNEDPANERLRSALALKFPTFINEVKLDGERMVFHVRRGVVTIQTRNAKWYSNVYSPVIAPAVRRAICGYDVDCILDGEIIAWDNQKKEVIPFGNNRTVAKVRRNYLHANGQINEMDMNLHDGEGDTNVQSVALGDSFIRSNKDNANILGVENPGAECWLKYVIFDILHVSGPDASRLIRKACAHLTPESSPDYARVSSLSGSILDLTGYHRRAILYELITPQPNEIEHVECFVVTSDGQCIDGGGVKDYFTGKVEEKYGYPLVALDSIDCLKNNVVPSLSDIDELRRSHRKDTDIDQERAYAMEKVYTRVVDQECEEGLIIKDLCAPYVYERGSSWFKLKADYSKLGYASDIDVIVLGANYATGLGKAGLLSHFVIGCIDDEHQAKDAAELKVMTLGRCSGNGTQRENLFKLLQITGFKAATATEDVQYGKWFRCDNHYRGFPDFVSKRSFQRSADGDYDGWKFENDKYPDVWIRPEDSFVISVNAAEIVSSDDYQAGVTLRFPRINRIRKEGRWKTGQGYVDGDEKRVTEAVTCKEIQDLFYSRDALRQARPSLDADGGRSQSIAAPHGAQPTACRFHTAHQHSQRKKRGGGKRGTTLVQVGASRIPTPTKATKLSRILEGYTFTVLEGSFKLKNGTLDAQEAATKGWYDDATKVEGRDDVIGFIQKHGGQCVLTASAAVDFVVGGERSDVRVSKYCHAIESAPLDILNGKAKKDENLRQMMKMGVVKWTFIFSVVNEMLDEIRKIKQDNEVSPDGNEDACLTTARSIKKHKPGLMRPRRFDYLVMSRVAEQILLESEDQYGVHLFEESSEIEFKRALAEVEKDKKRKADADDLSRKLSKVRGSLSQSASVLPWQYQAFEHFDENERWVFGGERQKFWPYADTTSNKNSTTSPTIGPSASSPHSNGPIVLYPDLFGADFGLKQEADTMEEVRSGDGRSWERWSSVLPSSESGDVASSLPLAKAMGALITPHLHNGITHVLVEMPRNLSLEWRPGISHHVFKDRVNGKALHYRLEELDDEESFSSRPGKGEVLLVTPEWIRRYWSST